MNQFKEDINSFGNLFTPDSSLIFLDVALKIFTLLVTCYIQYFLRRRLGRARTSLLFIINSFFY